jgi:hypothetical protein
VADVPSGLSLTPPQETIKKSVIGFVVFCVLAVSLLLRTFWYNILLTSSGTSDRSGIFRQNVGTRLPNYCTQFFSCYIAVSMRDNIALNCRVTGKHRIGKDLEVSGLDLIEVLSQHFHRRPEGNQGSTCPENVSKVN